MAITDDQYSALAQRVTDLETRLAAYDARIAGLEARMASGEGFINTALPDINAAKTQLTSVLLWKNDKVDPALAKLGPTLAALPMPK